MNKKYEERARIQCLQWAMGFSKHNIINDECCPDFSCCEPELFTEDSKERWEIYNNTYNKNSFSIDSIE